jgi:chorismate dehydratase
VNLSSIRLGVVPYLNVLPLVEGLGEAIPEENWIRATPRELAGLMAARELDISILPIFEAIRTPGYRILPGCAIACDGPIRSVKLFSLKPIDEIGTVILDRSSLSSVHLAQILLPRRISGAVKYVLSDHPLTTADRIESLDVDAAVVIGDTALEWDGTFAHEMDLGEEWKAQTGLPFVFAGWVARPDLPLSRPVLETFIEARSRGERDVYEIAKRTAGDDSSRLMNLVDYLSRAVRYRLGPREREGIERYAQELKALKLIGNRPSLEFVELESCPSPANPRL